MPVSNKDLSIALASRTLQALDGLPYPLLISCRWVVHCGVCLFVRCWRRVALLRPDPMPASHNPLPVCIQRSNARAGAVAIMHEARRKGWGPEGVSVAGLFLLDLLGLVVGFWSVGLWTYARKEEGTCLPCMHVCMGIYDTYIQALAAAKEKGLSFLKSAAQTDWVVAQLYKCVGGTGQTAGCLSLPLCVCAFVIDSGAHAPRN